MAFNLPTLLKVTMIGLVVSASLMNMDNGVNAIKTRNSQRLGVEAGQIPILRNKRQGITLDMKSPGGAGTASFGVGADIGTAIMEDNATFRVGAALAAGQGTTTGVGR